MKRNITLLALFALSQLCNSQVKIDYNIYLLLNSDKQEMNVVEKTINDSVQIKTFSFYKDISTERYKYVLTMRRDGKVYRDIKKTSLKNIDGEIVLYHYSYMHSVIPINDLSNYNIIDYEDLTDSEFKSFNRVLKNANTIYIIDANEILHGSPNYKAFEVTF